MGAVLTRGQVSPSQSVTRFEEVRLKVTSEIVLNKCIGLGVKFKMRL